MDDLESNLEIVKECDNESIIAETNQKRKKRKISELLSNFECEIVQNKSYEYESLTRSKRTKIESKNSVSDAPYFKLLSRDEQYGQFWRFCTEYILRGLSAIQIEELSNFSARDFAKLKKIHLQPDLYSLSVLIPLFLPKLELYKSNVVENGSPIVILISFSAMRCIEIARDAKIAIGNKMPLAKLFSKHIKLHEQEKFLSTNICDLATATPERLIQIILRSKNFLNSAKLIILDWQWSDAKNRRMIDLPEVRKPLCELLRDYLIPKVLTSKLKFLLF